MELEPIFRLVVAVVEVLAVLPDIDDLTQLVLMHTIDLLGHYELSALQEGLLTPIATDHVIGPFLLLAQIHGDGTELSRGTTLR